MKAKHWLLGIALAGSALVPAAFLQDVGSERAGELRRVVDVAADGALKGNSTYEYGRQRPLPAT